MSSANRKPNHVILVGRRLDGMQTGSSQYLKTYLKICREAGLSTQLIFAPRRSFGNLPFARIHPEFVELVDGVDWAVTVQVAGRYVSTSPAVWGRFLIRSMKEVARRLTGRKHAPYPSMLGAELSPAEARQVVDRARTYAPDVVTAEYSSFAPMLSAFPQAKRIVFLHDLFSLRAESFRSRGMDPDHVVVSLDQEAARCDAADLLIHASRVEEERLRVVMPDHQHIWMRPAVSANFPASTQRTTPHAVFMGSQHAGNHRALAFLREEVWPKLREKLPEAKLHVVGSIASTVDSAEAAEEGLSLIGRVEDLSSIASPDAIGVAPMQFGSGIPIKVVDYLAIGLPVIVTSGAIDPFGDALDGLVAIAQSDDHFTQIVAELLTDAERRETMVDAARQVTDRLDNGLLRDALSQAHQ
ncbi:glycosyltransferase [Loktanella sp. S4079]|uniref:glycosyltransferase n=1 Tax=Loktanella sp. S4079 TaxID=579483 RepID=UPI0005FA227A|nr:glycosyltransferase family 4 protein [Loktanella sp. S4079]KJZ18502.1 hypothetical protein TW80_13785 [Loktanella sp. S4079]